MTATLLSAERYAPFGFYLPILKGGEDPVTGEWYVEGPISEPSQDLQKDEMEQGEWKKSGLRKGLETFIALGQVVDWEHLYERTRDPEAIIGKGVEMYDAPHPVTGVVVPWLKVRLLKGQRLAQKAWGLLQSGGSLGFSVAGAAFGRAGKRITESAIYTMGITALPVQAKNAGTLQIAKALAALTLDRTDSERIDLFVPELLAGGVFPLFRALTATGDLPRSGPGVNAASVEDLGPRRKRRASAEADEDEEDDEDEEEALRGKKLPRRLVKQAREVQKALSYQLGEALAERLAA